MTIRNTTLYTILAIVNVALWCATFAHIHVNYYKQQESIRIMEDLKRQQLILRIELSRPPTTAPATKKVEESERTVREVQVRTEVFNREVENTERNVSRWQN